MARKCTENKERNEALEVRKNDMLVLFLMQGRNRKRKFQRTRKQSDFEVGPSQLFMFTRRYTNQSEIKTSRQLDDSPQGQA